MLLLLKVSVVASVQAPTIELKDFETIQGNSLVGNTPVFAPKLTVLGLLEGRNDIRLVFEQNYPMLSRVVACESEWDNSARGKAGEVGLAQFMPSTWDWMSQTARFYGDIYSEKDQLTLMVWAFNHGYASHWTCYRLLYK